MIDSAITKLLFTIFEHKFKELKPKVEFQEATVIVCSSGSYDRACVHCTHICLHYLCQHEMDERSSLS